MTDKAAEIAKFMAEELPADLSADEIWRRCAERFPAEKMTTFHRALEIAIEIAEADTH